MHRVLMFAAVLLFAAASVGAQAVPRLVRGFLDAYYTTPADGVWKPAPGYCDPKKWILIGDFNGDGRVDYVARILTGRKAAKKRFHLIAFLAKKDEFEPIPFLEEPFDRDFRRSGFIILRKGTEVNLGLGAEGEGPSMKLAADGVSHFLCFTDGFKNFIYRDGRMKELRDLD
jgi:hypothetical protein